MIPGFKATVIGVRFHIGVLVGRGAETSVDRDRHKMKLLEMDPNETGIWMVDEKGRGSFVPSGTISQVLVRLDREEHPEDELKPIKQKAS